LHTELPTARQQNTTLRTLNVLERSVMPFPKPRFAVAAGRSSNSAWLRGRWRTW
jgi:hypothetical protein